MREPWENKSQQAPSCRPARACRALPTSPCSVREGGRWVLWVPVRLGKHQLQWEGRPVQGPPAGTGGGQPALVRALKCSFESTFRGPQPWGQGWRNNNKTTFA